MRGYAILIALLLGVPSAAAAWHTMGTTEPDTPQDVAGGLMTATADQSPAGQRVYFNVVPVESSTNANPNSDATEGRAYPVGQARFRAFLGVWKDCNKDGYMGLARGALLEYRHELLLGDASVCKVGTAWDDGEWVYEFRWLGPLGEP